MSTNDPARTLSRSEIESLERLLAEFDLTWQEGRLAEYAARLPSGGPLRRVALVEMIKIDLERRWRRGQDRPVGEYVGELPELAAAGGPPAELIEAERDLRREFGRPAPDTAPGGSPDASATDPGLPERFGGYQILGRLGHGGMGRVYLAYDDRLDRRVALKVPRRELLDDPNVVERFLREGRAAATVHHPNLCPVYDADQVGGTPYLAMAYLEGRSLAELIDPPAPFPLDRAVGLVAGIARGMAAAHAAGVVHRDLKPSNIMITPSGDPVVMDFGLAWRAADARISQPGSFLGTPAYMPPEQVKGEPGSVAPHSDVYSLGVILYELVTGRRPFTGSFGDVVNRVLNESPVPPSRLRRGLDPRLEAVCLKAMAKRPADRYAGMAEFAAALEATRAEPVRPTTPRWWVWPAVAVAVIAVIAVLSGQQESGGPPATPPADDKPIAATGDPKRIDTPPNPKLVTPAPVDRPPPLSAIIKHHLKPATFPIDPPPAGVGSVAAVGFGPDGRPTAVGTDTYCRTWAVETGKEVGKAWRTGQFARQWGFQPGGHRLVLESVSDLVLVNLRTEKWENEVPFRFGVSSAPAFSADGRRAAWGHSGVGSRGVVVWEVRSATQYRLAGLRHGPVTVSLSPPDGKQVITAGEDGVWWFNVDKNEKIDSLDALTAARAVAFVGGASRAVIAERAGALALWDLTTKQRVHELDGHTALVTCLAVSHDFKRLLSGSDDNTARVWDVATGKELVRLDGHTAEVTCVAFSDDGAHCLTGSKDGTVRWWQLSEQK